MITPIQPETASGRPIESSVQTTVANAGFRHSLERTKWGPVIRALRDLRQLRDDWDGEGSDPPPHKLIETGIRLVPVLREWGAEIPASAVASRRYHHLRVARRSALRGDRSRRPEQIGVDDD